MEKETIQEKRLRLRALSAEAKDIKEALLNECETPEESLKISAMRINDVLIEKIYKDETHQEFRSFKGWLKEGFCVKKGEKAFLVWGRPKQENKDGELKSVIEVDGEDHNFFPISFVFSNAQVKSLEQKD